MSPLKVIIPLFIVLGVLQGAVLTLPFIYWRFAAHLGPINKFLFGSSLLFLAFIAHPLLVITLITFTIAPALLSLRTNLTSRFSTAYTALVPASLFDRAPSDPPLRKVNRDYLITLLSSYVGWKTLGALPSLMILLVLVGLWKGREADGDRGWLAKGLREGNENVEERRKGKGKGVATRSSRTDVQIVG